MGEGQPGNPEPKKSPELEATAIGENETLINAVRPFIESASSFPQDVRQKLAQMLVLTEEELNDITASTDETLEWVQVWQDESPEKQRRYRLRREIGQRIFNKMYDYLISPPLAGEASVNRFNVEHAADNFVEAIRPLLIPELGGGEPND